jgi:hypothetical protein
MSNFTLFFSQEKRAMLRCNICMDRNKNFFVRTAAPWPIAFYKNLGGKSSKLGLLYAKELAANDKLIQVQGDEKFSS